MTTTTINRLRNLDLFQGCTRSQLKQIDQLGIALSFAPGRTLCVEGSPGAEFFVLVDGLVAASRSAGTVSLMRPGSWFGETALLRNRPRAATVTVRCESTVIVFERREFNTLLSIAPRVRERLERTAEFFAGQAAPTEARPVMDRGDAPFQAVG
jgi:CRP/FNR family transcriptional regulator, cyclic AMP receptor protein